MTYPGANGETVNLTDDAQGRLYSLIGTDTYVQSISYDLSNRITDLVRGVGVLDTQTPYNTWDTQGGRLQSITTTEISPQTVLQQLAYGYDLVGNITTISDNVNSEVQSYGYDALNRLTSWTLNNGQPEIYGYSDTTGNLSNKAGVAYNLYDANHAHAVASLTNGNSYTYDANGNMTSRTVSGQTFNFGYDAENRLVSVSGAATASFVYDGDGNRVQSIIGGTTTTFVGNYYEVSGDNITQYYYAGTQRVAMRKDGTLTFMLSDQLGSTSVTTDSSGQNPTTLEYDPWGGTRFASKDGNGNDNTPTNYRYTGQRQEPSFGLYFYQARWYDPGISQFASPDTMIPNTYNPLDWNRYSYTDDNPVNRTDPTGHRNCEEDDYDCYAEPTTPTTTATATPRPPCSICSTNQYAQSLYNAVRSHQSQLPPGFPPALLLAMAAVESGGNTPPYQNSTTQGGALQLRGSNASESTYPDTQTGYDQNVSDAIKFINTEYSNAAATTGELTHFHYLYTNIYPNNADEVTAARTVLYYNGGMGWMDKSPDNPYSYWNSPGNKPYVGNVAGMLTSYVPKQFGLDAGPTLINILISVQADVNASVP